MRKALPLLAALALALAGAACAEPSRGGLGGELIALDAADAGRERFGQLLFRGGLRLSAGNRSFGGLSAMHLAEDGRMLTMVSDRGHWFRTRLVHDSDGRLIGTEGLESAPLLDRQGRPVMRPFHDAEGLAQAPGGGFFVSFEHRHRLWRYRNISSPAEALDGPDGLPSLPRNQGIEALTELPDGRLLLMAEGGGRASGPAWLGRPGGPWQRLDYPRHGDYKPTGATLAPDGDILVVERRFSLLGGIGARILRIPLAGVVAGDLRGEELAELAPPLSVDNFEAIAAHRGPTGQTYIYLLSDDNLSALQSTLLLMFATDPRP